VAAIELHGMRYVAVVLQGSEESRWKDTHTLFDEIAGVPGEIVVP